LQFALFQGKKSHLRGREQRLIQFLADNRAEHTPLPLDEQLRHYAIVTHEGNLFEILRLDGSPLFPLTVNDADRIFPSSDDCAKTIFFFQRLQHQSVMVMCHQILLDGQSVRLYLGGALDEEIYMLRIYRNALSLLMPVLLSLAVVSGYLLSRHALK